MPFILREVALAGANSVDAPLSLRQRAWAMLGEELDLAAFDEMSATVGLADETDIHQSTVSRHLSALERYGVVSVRKDGKSKHYQLQRDRVDLALKTVRNALGEDQP